jgi:hypothetical protein
MKLRFFSTLRYAIFFGLILMLLPAMRVNAFETNKAFEKPILPKIEKIHNASIAQEKSTEIAPEDLLFRY